MNLTSQNGRARSGSVRRGANTNTIGSTASRALTDMKYIVPGTAPYHPKIGRLVAENNVLLRLISQYKQQLQEVRQQEASILSAQELVQSIAKTVEQTAHERIATIVTRCLQAVFGTDAYEFRVLFENKRGKTEAKMVFVEDGNELDPMGGSGGGVIDVAAFALRLTSLVLARPQKRRLLVLDEPFKWVSKEYRQALRDLLQSLCKEMGLQIIMVTHIQELALGKVIEL